MSHQREESRSWDWDSPRCRAQLDEVFFPPAWLHPDGQRRTQGVLELLWALPEIQSQARDVSSQIQQAGVTRGRSQEEVWICGSGASKELWCQVQDQHLSVLQRHRGAPGRIWAQEAQGPLWSWQAGDHRLSSCPPSFPRLQPEAELQQAFQIEKGAEEPPYLPVPGQNRGDGEDSSCGGGGWRHGVWKVHTGAPVSAGIRVQPHSLYSTTPHCLHLTGQESQLREPQPVRLQGTQIFTI